jgi:hypothetical protein
MTTEEIKEGINILETVIPKGIVIVNENNTIKMAGRVISFPTSWKIKYILRNVVLQELRRNRLINENQTDECKRLIKEKYEES